MYSSMMKSQSSGAAMGMSNWPGSKHWISSTAAADMFAVLPASERVPLGLGVECV